MAAERAKRLEVAAELTVARRRHSLRHGRRRLFPAYLSQARKGGAGDFYAHIDAIEQRTAQPARILPQTMGGALALALRVAAKTARTRIHGRH